MYRNVGKRFLDILICFAVFPLLLIFLLPVSLLIKLDDQGPVFYNADRYGKNMKVFKMFKFRSMKVNAPDIRNLDGSTYNSADDPRLTRVGKFIRKASIDELPQVINVLIGDMSFVGPRPSPLGDKSNYPHEFFRRYEVLPGVTGYNQIMLRNKASLAERIENDNFYVDNLSFGLDLKIVLMTLVTVLTSKNIYRN